ncbi:sulfite exporter TauE/SafE family protein [Colwellia sp. 75C3]|uniref:sulfite exporter TauE/SafE family protein n=1 Tax=Colwellia sp. 75C3 TaxID=888425 RepID=UPI000C333036|nr:sulfite exporter TauE/SafE family protein [Colwellia sp. 75C3]PKG86262.1 sulfite exporter TauE/SafE family protein [Colwellia sp. 75C3]
MSKESFMRLSNPKFIVLFLVLWTGLLLSSSYALAELADYRLFTFLGTIGAIFANSTGAGGGVVFIPMFTQLNFTEQQSIATSFAIQCFGMTAGAVTWWHHYKTEKTELRLWQGFKRIICVTTIASIIGLNAVFIYQVNSPAALPLSFSWFSLLLGFFIILTIYLLQPHRERSQLYYVDYIAMVLIGLFGGAVTAWLSVGVGELLVIYLLLRHFDISMAVAAAVIVSAITVWTAIAQVNSDVYWQVVLFAGPGAVLGGLFAKTVVTHLSATKLKLFFACWLLLSGAVGLS